MDETPATFWAEKAALADRKVFPLLVESVGGYPGMRLDMETSRGYMAAYRVVHALFHAGNHEGLKAMLGTASPGSRLLRPNGLDVMDIRYPPLVLAVQCGLWDIIPWLLEQGADPNEGDKSGHLPLQLAALKAPDAAWHALLEVSHTNNGNDDGTTAAHALAADTDFSDSAATIHALRRWRDLREHGFVGPCDSRGRTPDGILAGRGLPSFDALVAAQEAAALMDATPLPVALPPRSGAPRL